MTKIVASIIVASMLLFMSASKPSEDINLTVEVTNFENKDASKVWVSVFSKKDFLEKSIQTKSVIASGDKVIVEFDLPPGEYAVSTYQDVNGNSKLDRYIIGKPKEPYGFSNNVKPLGPPNFKACQITLTQSAKTISIKLIN